MLKQQKDACKTIVADKNRLIEEFQNVGQILNSSQINLQDKCKRITFESYFPFLCNWLPLENLIPLQLIFPL